MREIKSIQTEYDGHLFRSRLEAKWAVFFNSAGIEYQYEEEGFHLPNGKRYLPDFYLPDVRVLSKKGLYVEVKGKLTDEDYDNLSGMRETSFQRSNEMYTLWLSNQSACYCKRDNS